MREALLAGSDHLDAKSPMGHDHCSSRWQLVLLSSLFILWGACNALNDVLIRAFQMSLSLGDAASSLVQTAFYFGYFFGAMPAAVLARWKGYKTCVCWGLLLVCTGCALFYPSSRNDDAMRYPLMLACLYLIAFGLAFLECSANPWIVLLGNRRRAGGGTFALNLAQSFNPLGAVGGVLLGRQLILSRESEEQIEAVGYTYLRLSAVFAAVLAGVVSTRFSAGNGGGAGARARRCLPFSCQMVGACLRVRGFTCGVAAQFLCIGAQTCVWSFTIRYVTVALPSLTDQQAADALLLSLLLFLAGRFASTATLRCIAADRLMAVQCAAASVSCLVAASASGMLGVAALCTVSAFMGMLFPTIFGLALGQLDSELTELGASLLVMSIVGGEIGRAHV